MQFTASTPVGQIVTLHPVAATLFQRLGIDFCCGGKQPLSDACSAQSLALEPVLQELSGLTTIAGRDWTRASMTELADHIEATHHAYLKQELPSLRMLVRKVAARHGQTRPELVELNNVYESFADEMFEHMGKEEGVLFPALRDLDSTGQSRFHSFDTPIGCLVHEHEDAGRALSRMRALTNGYKAGEGACMSLVGALAALERLEHDTHLHVHKENNILFPMAQRVVAEFTRA